MRDNDTNADATADAPVFRIPEPRLPELEERLKKFNRRAKRLGRDPLVATTIEVEVIRRWECRQCRYDGKPVRLTEEALHHHQHPLDTYEDGERLFSEPIEIAPKRYHHVRIDGQIPKVEGWTFIATLDYEEAGVILRDRPGHETPVEYRSVTTPYCDHCNTRRRRNNTFVLRNDETGAHQMVGRNCLADFLRSSDPKDALSWLEFERFLGSFGSGEDDDDMFEGGGGRYTPPEYTLSWLAATHAIIREFGYVTSKVANPPFSVSTRDRVFSFKNPPIDRDSRRCWEEEYGKVTVDDRDKRRARATVAWVRTELTGTSDFVHNLKVLFAEQAFETECNEKGQDGLTAHSFKPKHAGFVTAALGCYLRHMDKLAEANRTTFTNEHTGTIKERREWVLTLEGVRWFEGDYGRRGLFRFLDDDGHLIVWWTNTNQDVWGEVNGEKVREDLDALVGYTFNVKATVKKHTEYKGTKQTEVSRASILEILRDRDENERRQGQALVGDENGEAA